jgi:hypothetical protein
MDGDMASRRRGRCHLLVEPVRWCDTILPAIGNPASAAHTTGEWDYPGNPAGETASVLTTGGVVTVPR